MTKQTFDINKLRVASPCSVSWDGMKGDARVRHCDSCKLNVYNIAEMTRAEAENLVKNREGRLCVRFYRRTDGTVLTKDCPVGLRAYQKRVARFAGAALTAILGLFSVSFGQKDDKKTINALNDKVVKTLTQNKEGSLNGNVLDPNGAVVPGAEINLSKKDNKKNIFKVNTDTNGNYAFDSLAAGIYILEIKSPGFKTHRFVIEIKDGEKNQLDITLEAAGKTVWIGIYADESIVVDPGSSSLQTTITKDMMNKLPH